MDDLVPTFADAVPASNGSSIAAPILEELGNEVDLATCRLLGPFALVIQGIMGAVVILSLVAKRMREKPRRKWKIWLGDVSKQVVGQAFVHSANIAISDLIALHTSDNPCSLYALNILVDTTLGVLILYYLLRLSTHLMHTTFNQPAYQTGFYGSPFSLTLWGEQAAIYVACLTAMKIVVLFLFWAFPVLEDMMSWLLGWVTDDEAQVFLVMLVLPLVMNLFQFLMVDSILKSKDGAGSDAFDSRLEETDEEALRRGFLDSHDDEDDDESDHEGGAGGHAAAGYSDSSPKVGRGSGQSNGRRGEGAHAGVKGGERGAERGLLDAADEGASRDGPDFFALSMPAQHAYPPGARPPSPSTASTTLPPYSAHPPAHAIRQSVDEEDDWSADWDQASASDSTSEAGGRRRGESIPLEPVKPVAPTPVESRTPLAPSQPTRASHVRVMSEDVGGGDEWGFDADAPDEADQEGDTRGESTPPAPSTPTPQHTPPAPTHPATSTAFASSSADPPVHDDGDEWGIDEADHVEHVSPAAPDAPPSPASARVPQPESAPSEPNAVPSSPSPPPTLGHSVPSPAQPEPPVRHVAAPRQSVDGADDWGFDAQGDAHPQAGDEAGQAPDSAARSPPPRSNGHSHPAPDAGEDDEDDWGFDGLGSPASRHGHSASISSAFGVELAQPAQSADAPSSDAIDETARRPGRRPSTATGGDEEDDDWGFDDSPSLTMSALDPSVKDVVAELEARKKGGNGASVRETDEGESLI